MSNDQNTKRLKPQLLSIVTCVLYLCVLYKVRLRNRLNSIDYKMYTNRIFSIFVNYLRIGIILYGV